MKNHLGLDFKSSANSFVDPTMTKSKSCLCFTCIYKQHHSNFLVSCTILSQTLWWSWSNPKSHIQIFLSDSFKLYETLKCSPLSLRYWTWIWILIFPLFCYYGNCWLPKSDTLAFIHILLFPVPISFLRACCSLFACLFWTPYTDGFLSNLGEVYITP